MLNSTQLSTFARFVRFYLVLLALAVVLGNIDYELARRTGRGWLSVPLFGLLDGGSFERYGLGYTLTDRHQILRREGDVTHYLVGPKLEAWNVFNVFGARVLLDREYGQELHYAGDDRTNPVVTATQGGAPFLHHLFLAIADALPTAILLLLFLAWTRRHKRKHTPAFAIPTATQQPTTPANETPS